MKHYFFISILMMSVQASAQSADCIPVAPTEARGTSAHFEKPGRYCVQQDFVPKAYYDWHRQQNVGQESFFYVDSPDVLIDLGGHSLRPAAAARSLIENGSQVGQKVHDVTVRNGQLTGPAWLGVTLGAFGTSFSRPESLLSDIDPKLLANDKAIMPTLGPRTFSEAARESFQTYRNAVPPAAQFPRGGFVLEKLHIRLTNKRRSIGAMLQGADNIVRDCTIEVDGTIGLYLIGPRAVVENNTIIIHNVGPQRPANAAIKLDRADGSVIRNNRIVIKGKGAPEQAVSLIESKDVRFENNTVTGAKVIYKAFDDQSSLIESGTVLK